MLLGEYLFALKITIFWEYTGNWQLFLSGFNGHSFFLADQWKNSNQLELYTDASGALGYSAVFVFGLEG